MLNELFIENFAIIERLLMRFSPGFTVLTGETGAGKSIIIDALQVALGGKAGSDVVRGDARYAAVEAVFDWPNDSSTAGVLAEHGIEAEGCLILRREVTSAGRTSSRVNGRAVPLSTLSAIGSRLVDIHGQSDHLSVLRRDRQLDVLDRFGNLSNERTEVSSAIHEYSRLRRQLDELASSQRESEQRLDLLRFQVQEIEEANLRSGEESDLEAERTRLANAEKLAEIAGSSFDVLQGEGGAVAGGLLQAAHFARELAGIDPNMTPVAERLESARFEVDDLAQEIRQYRDQVEFDPTRLNSVEERLDLLFRLKRKYGATVEDVIAFGARVRGEMEEAENFDQRLSDLTVRVGEAEAQAGSAAATLSEVRGRVAAHLNNAMHAALQGLGLRNTQFQVDLARSTSDDGLPLPPASTRYAYGAWGVDAVTFLVSFNPGEALRPLDRVASGGETSRFLLALKSVLAEADQTGTLIFDEVDVGVGARSGVVVGERLSALAASHQVISITHLPQVAALAHHHVRVSKAVHDERTSVDARHLEGAERVAEIAEMMSGTGTEAARRNAEELLEAAQRTR